MFVCKKFKKHFLKPLRMFLSFRLFLVFFLVAIFIGPLFVSTACRARAKAQNLSACPETSDFSTSKRMFPAVVVCLLTSANLSYFLLRRNVNSFIFKIGSGCISQFFFDLVRKRKCLNSILPEFSLG